MVLTWLDAKRREQAKTRKTRLNVSNLLAEMGRQRVPSTPSPSPPVADGTFFVIEAKDEVELSRGEMHKSETEQLLHSLEWFKQEYPGKSARPLIIHPATATAYAAVFATEGRVVTPDVG